MVGVKWLSFSRWMAAGLGVALVGGVGVPTAAATPALSAPTAAQEAEVDCSTDSVGPQITSVSPTTIGVGLSEKKVRFHVHASDPCGIAGWALSSHRVDGGYSVHSGDPYNTFHTVPHKWNPIDSNLGAGYGDMKVSVTDSSDQRNTTEVMFPVRLQRQTTFQTGMTTLQNSFLSTRGSVELKSRLLRANWRTKKYEAFADQSVALEFRYKGSPIWYHKRFALSDKEGWVRGFTTSDRASQDLHGDWRLRYYGTDSSTPTTSPTHTTKWDIPFPDGKQNPVMEPIDCTADTTGPVISRISRNSITAGVTHKKVPLSATVSDPCGVHYWEMYGSPPRAYYPLFGSTNTDPYAAVGPSSFNWVSGWVDLGVWAQDNASTPTNFGGRNSSSRTFPFQFLRQTTWNNSGMQITSPNRAREFVIQIQLLRADWEKKSYQPLKWVRVALQFKADGSTTWQHKKFVMTYNEGWAKAAYNGQDRLLPGVWRLHYHGDERSSPTSSTEVRF